MPQLAVVSTPNSWPAHWEFPDLELHHHASVASLETDVTVDGILLVDPTADELLSLFRGLDERERRGAVAILVAGRPDAPNMAGLVGHRCDGFLDRAWPSALAGAAIQTALGHVDLGRNMVEIQRVVLAESRQQMTTLYDLANHDGLTNLFNHRYFAAHMERQHERSKTMGESYAMVFIDLDDLKQLNTRYGYAGGSQALNELARIIASSIRSTDVAVRVGGDEFAVFLSNSDQQGGTDFASRLCAKLRSHQFEVDDQQLSITVSCGISSYPEDSSRYADLLKHADKALLHAKALGKNRAVGYAPSLQLPLPC